MHNPCTCPEQHLCVAAFIIWQHFIRPDLHGCTCLVSFDVLLSQAGTLETYMCASVEVGLRDMHCCGCVWAILQG